MKRVKNGPQNVVYTQVPNILPRTAVTPWTCSISVKPKLYFPHLRVRVTQISSSELVCVGCVQTFQYCVLEVHYAMRSICACVECILRAVSRNQYKKNSPMVSVAVRLRARFGVYQGPQILLSGVRSQRTHFTHADTKKCKVCERLHRAYAYTLS